MAVGRQKPTDQAKVLTTGQATPAGMNPTIDFQDQQVAFDPVVSLSPEAQHRAVELTRTSA